MSADGFLILSDLSQHKVVFDLTLDGLGEELARGFAYGVYKHMDAETDPQGHGWIDLTEAYSRWKRDHFPGQLMAHLYGVMKTDEQLVGTLTIKSDGMEQTYGVDEQAQNEAVWFQEGNENQASRPFYDWNEESEAMVSEILDNRFDLIIGP